jgi:hypothetical protein
MPRCKNTNCPYDRDGRCIENLLPNCPNLSTDAATPTDEAAPPPVETSEIPTGPQFEDLPSGKKLTVAEATQILQSKPAQIVVLGGMVESGKTTLIARIFEMLQNSPVANHNFAASRTLAEFDKLSWHSTMESQGANPTTEHTYRSENNHFLHLRVRAVDNAAAMDVLICDIPGEIFPEAVAEEGVCLDLCALRRADHLVLFLDGAVMCKIHDRHDPCGKILDFVDRAIQTGQIGLHTALHLVISKCDMLPQSPDDEVLLFVNSTEQSFRERYAGKFGDLKTWRIAARPVHPVLPTVETIEEIFGTWITTSHQQVNGAVEAPRRTGFTRDFCRFGL